MPEDLSQASMGAYLGRRLSNEYCNEWIEKSILIKMLKLAGFLSKSVGFGNIA